MTQEQYNDLMDEREKQWRENNCLFCPTDNWLHSQQLEGDAERWVEKLNAESTHKKWRIDRSAYQFSAVPTLCKQHGGHVYDNPCTLWEGHVWVTCAPEGSTCGVMKDKRVVVDSGVYNLYKDAFDPEENYAK